MKLPADVVLKDPVLPDDLDGVENGKVPLPLLRALPGATNGRYDHLAWHGLIEPFTKMVAAFKAERDRNLSYTGGYRSFAQQDALFRSRHRVDSRGPKTYAGLRWSLIPGMANANIPGTSNHGYGLALDLAIGTPQAFTSLTIPDILWLISRAPDFGFFGENASEGWHWVLHPDRLPKPPPEPPISEDEMPDYMIRVGDSWDVFACYASGKVRHLGPAEFAYLKTLKVPFADGAVGPSGEKDQAEIDRLSAAAAR